MSKSTLWLVVARSGSRGIPHKNVKPLAGVPLLEWRIRAALAVAPPENVWVSTDSPEYAELARACGATVPFLRPAELARDDTPSAAVVRHAMEHAGPRFEILGLLEPTSPLVPARDLAAAAELLLASPDADGCVAVREVRPSTFYVQEESRFLAVLAERMADRGVLRRQDLRPEVTPSGGFYLTRWQAFLEQESFYTPKTLAYQVDDFSGLEIDELLDWEWAEFLLEKGRVDRARIFGL